MYRSKWETKKSEPGARAPRPTKCPPKTPLPGTNLKRYTVPQLQILIREARQLILAHCEEDEFTRIRGQEEAKDAILIAAVQGHPIAFIGPHRCGKTMLCRAAATIGVDTREIMSCPCGLFNDRAKTCRCTAATLRRHVIGISPDLDRCDMFVLLTHVYGHELLNASPTGLTLDRVREKLHALGRLPPDNLMLTPTTRDLLNDALSADPPTVGELGTAMSIARSIASLENSTIIEPEYLFTAFQYRRPKFLTELKPKKERKPKP